MMLPLFPARSVIAEILRRMTDAGWREVKSESEHRFLDAVDELGWVFYVDATKEPEQGVYQWTREWQNASGYRVFCVLRYTAAGAERESEVLRPLKVTARYFRAVEAEALKGSPS
jgi:hypothetical protein